MRINSINCRTKFTKLLIHSHAMWEIILTCEGYGSIVIEDKEYEFEPGKIICIPPNQTHYNVLKGNVTHVYMRVDDFFAPSALNVPIILRDDEERSFETLSHLALRMFYKESPNNESILTSLTETIFQLLLSLINTYSKTNEAELFNEIELFKNHLISNFTDPEFHASDILKKVPYNIDHFRKCFKKDTGITPTAYLLHLRVEYAKKLLTQQHSSQVRISDIALRAGFYDALYFSRVFKSIVGINPKKYIAQQQIKL